jgi:hypothetical protein
MMRSLQVEVMCPMLETQPLVSHKRRRLVDDLSCPSMCLTVLLLLPMLLVLVSGMRV